MKNLPIAFFLIFFYCQLKAGTLYTPIHIKPRYVSNQNITLPQFGSAANFAIYTVSGAIGNTAASSITGDIGSNSGAVTGFGSSTLVGGTYSGGNITAKCSADLLVAYNQLSAITATATHTPAFGSSETLNPGVYYVAGAGSVAGSLVLDAQGDQNAVFIFKVGGAFTTGAGTAVSLINGASANNIFWVVEGAISMAASTSMKGTLIANNGAVSMGAGGTLEGRLFSTTGAIATYADNIYLPIFIWIGAVSTNWTTAANWFNNAVPTINDQSVVGMCRSFNYAPTIPVSSGLISVGSITFGTVGGQAPGLVVNAGSTLNVTGSIFYQSDEGSPLGYSCTLSGAGIIAAKSMAIFANTTLPAQPYNQLFSSSVANLTVASYIALTSTKVGSDVFNSGFNVAGGIVLINGIIQTINHAGNTSTFTVIPLSTATLQLSNINALSGLSVSGTNAISFKNTGATIEYSGAAQTVYNNASLPGLTSGINYQNIKISGTGLKTMPAGSLNITGDFTNTLANDVNNNINILASEVNFNGTAQSLIGGAGTGTAFKNITFSGIGTKTLANGNFSVSSIGILTLSGTNVNTILNAGASLLTLNSDSAGSATVAQLNGPVINGVVIVQRYINGGSAAHRGYRLLSSAVSDPLSSQYYNLSYLKGSGTFLTGNATGVGPTGFDAAGNPTIYLYRQDMVPNNASFTSGIFRPITAIDNSPAYNLSTPDGNFNMPKGNGFLFFYRGNNGINPATIPSSLTFNMPGNLNQGQISVSPWFYATDKTSFSAPGTLSYSLTSGSVAVQGFNLVGNPYASSIDWNTAYNGTATTGIYAPNTDQVVYIYNAVTKNFSTYKNFSASSGISSGSPGGSNIIASGQGFFVHAIAAGAKLVFNESAKVNLQPAVLLLNAATPIVNQYLRLQLSKDAINKDETIVFLSSTASTAYSINEDAMYLKGNGVLGLSNFSSDNKLLAINKMPFPKQSQAINLNITATNTGLYQLNMTEMKNIPCVYDLWLKDTYKKDSIDIKHNPVYSFDITNDTLSKGNKRFLLVLRKNPALAYHLLSFSSVKVQAGAQLTWATEREENYTTFNLQRSTDGGTTFIDMAVIPSTSAGIYSFTDFGPIIGVNQYRLQQQYLDDISYSTIVPLEYNNTKASIINTGNISLYPNPVKNTVNIAITAPNKGVTKYTISIANNIGNVIRSYTSASPNWQNDVTDLKPNMYIINVINNADKTVVGTTKFIKL